MTCSWAGDQTPDEAATRRHRGTVSAPTELARCGLDQADRRDPMRSGPRTRRRRSAPHRVVLYLPEHVACPLSTSCHDRDVQPWGLMTSITPFNTPVTLFAPISPTFGPLRTLSPSMRPPVPAGRTRCRLADSAAPARDLEKRIMARLFREISIRPSTHEITMRYTMDANGKHGRSAVQWLGEGLPRACPLGADNCRR